MIMEQRLKLEHLLDPPKKVKGYRTKQAYFNAVFGGKWKIGGPFYPMWFDETDEGRHISRCCRGVDEWENSTGTVYYLYGSHVPIEITFDEKWDKESYAQRKINCRFGCESKHLTLVHYPSGCWCFPKEKYQWLCPQHTIKGLQNNEGYIIEGFMKDKEF